MRQNKGFTLMELLMVTAVIGCLILLIVPAVSTARERGQTVNCINNMKQLAIAALMYADDHGEVVPDIAADGRVPAHNLVDTNYIDDERMYICPRDKRGEAVLGAAGTSYTAWQFTIKSLKPSEVKGFYSERVLYVESQEAGMVDNVAITGKKVTFDRHDGRSIVVFADGHVFSGNSNDISMFLGIGIPPEGEGEGEGEEEGGDI